MSHKTSTEWKNQQEDLLIAIDQLAQMTEVMGEVLCRVKQQVNELEKHTIESNSHPVDTRQCKPVTGPKVKNTTRRNQTKKVDLVH